MSEHVDANGNVLVPPPWPLGAAASSTLSRGTVLAERYVIEALLGRGGYGEVYLAKQLSIGRRVAVKLLRSDLSRDPKVAARFNREAQQTSKLAHPNTVTIYDFGWDGSLGLLYLAMEYVDGPSLKQVLTQEQRLPPERALDLLGQIAASLAQAHERGLVHRDLKPANVMLTQQEGRSEVVKIIDFGIAKAVSGGSAGDGSSPLGSLTTTGAILGTPHYLAPEQAGEGVCDARVDVYAAGVMAFEMLTGQLPFVASSVFAIIQKHVSEPVPSVFDVAPGIVLPPAIDGVLRHAMAKRAADRPSSVSDFVAELRRCFEVDRGVTLGAKHHREPPLRVAAVPLAVHGLTTLSPSSTAHAALSPRTSEGDGASPAATPPQVEPRRASGAPRRRPYAWIVGMALVVGLSAAAVAIALRALPSSREEVGSEAAESASSTSPRPVSVENPPAPAREAPLLQQASLRGAVTKLGAAPTPALVDTLRRQHALQALAALMGRGLALSCRGALAREPAPPPQVAEQPLLPLTAPPPAEPSPAEPSATSSERVSCRVTVRPWGEVWVDGQRAEQLDQVATLRARRGAWLQLELRQAGVTVVSQRAQVPAQGECRFALRRE